MATIVAIIGDSGDGKTSSTIINPDGKCDFQNYDGMNPETHFIINLDRKTLPFPSGMWSREKKNYAEPQTFEQIKQCLVFCAKNEQIKSVAIDTINIYLAMREFNDRKRLSYDQLK